jgi:hypothetical protein
VDTDTRPAAPDALDWRGDARHAVTSLYQAHAVGLIRLGVVMLGDRAGAEDVVQEAFCGLYRRWEHLSSPGHALPYLTASGQPEKLRELPIRPERRFISGIALSPDGTKLAVAVQRGAPVTGTRNPKIEVFSTATGSERQWVWHGSGWIGLSKPAGQGLSWADNGTTLAFQLNSHANDPTVEVRLLDTAAPGGSLRASRLVLDFPPRGRAGWFLVDSNALLTPDGSLVVAPIIRTQGNSRHAMVQLAITEFSAATGRPVHAVDRWASRAAWVEYSLQDVLWTGAGGRVMIVVSLVRRGGAGTPTFAIGVQTGRRFEPLPAWVQKWRSVGVPSEIAW